MYTQCPRCGAELSDPGRDFSCPRCGAAVKSLGTGFVEVDEGMGPLASIHMSDQPGWKALPLALQQLARLAAFVLFGVSLLLCFAALFVGVPMVFGGEPGSDLGAVLYILTPAPLGLVQLSGAPFLAYYSFLVVAITASILYLLWSERRKLRPLLSASVSRFRSPDRNSEPGLVQLPQVFLAIFFFDMVYAMAVWLAGTSPRTPAFESFPDWYLFYTFANASVYEEFAARTLLLGVPLLVAYFLAFSFRREPLALEALARTPPRSESAPSAAGIGTGAPPPQPGPRTAPSPPLPGTAPSPTPPGAVPAPPPDLLIDLPLEGATPRTLPNLPERPDGLLATPAPLPFEAAAPLPPPIKKAPPPAVRAPPRHVGDYLRSRTAHGLWGYLLGGGFRIGPLEAFFLVGSSLMFGLAHAASWDAWKVLPTFIAGLGFGYLFLKVGIHAAILLHFSFDYLSLGQGLIPGFALMELLLILLWIVVGAFYFGHYAVRSVKWLYNTIFAARG